MKKILKKICLTALVLCLAASLSGPLANADNEEQTSVLVNLESIYDLSYSGSIDSKIADKKLQIFNHDLDDLNNEIKAAWTAAGSSDPLTRMYGNIMVQSLIPKQIPEQGKKRTELSVELAKRQAALGGRSMLIAYINSQLQSDQLSIERNRLSLNTAAAKKMAELGLKTELEVKEIENSYDKLNNSIQKIQDGIARLKTQLSLYIDVDESLIKIEDFAGNSAEEANKILTGINYKEDLESSRKNNMTIQIQELAVKDATGLNKEEESLNLKKLKDQFPVDFDALYKSLNQAALNLKDTEGSFKISESNYKYAEQKYETGLISKLDLNDIKSQFLTEEKKLESAKLAFSASYYNYKAMLGGVWQNSMEQ